MILRFTYFLSVLLTSVSLAGCTSEVEQKEQIIHTKSCSIDIEGMMCEKGCKTTIQQRISEMEGVIDSDVNYEAAKASVTYDANKLSAKDIIAMINEIADGIYTAKLVEDKDIENMPINAEGDNDGTASVTTYSFEVPSFSSIFTAIL